MEISHLNLVEKASSEEFSSKLFYKNNPKKLSEAAKKTAILSEDQLIVLKLGLAVYQTYKLEEPSTTSELETLSAYEEVLPKKNITTLKEVQMILNILTIEVMFFHFLKLNNELLDQERKRAKKYEDLKEAQKDYEFLTVGELIDIPFDESTGIAEVMHYRFQNRNWVRGFISGDREFLDYASSAGNEAEKRAAIRIMENLSEGENSKHLDLFHVKLAAFTRAIDSFLKEEPLFKAFYSLNAFRVKLYNLEVEELIKGSEAILEAKNDRHYFAFIHSDLDAVILEKKQLLEKWELQCGAVIELYKKVHEIGKKLVHRNVTLYKECFGNLFADEQELAFSSLLEPPDAFKKVFLSLFSDSSVDSNPKEIVQEETVKEVKKAKSIQRKKAQKTKKIAKKKQMRKSIVEKKEGEESAAVASTSLVVPFTYPYAPRVSRWWEQDVPLEYQSLSQTHQALQKTCHNFSRQVDDYVFSYGVKAKWPNETTYALDTIYLLPGTLTFKESQAKLRGVFTYCVGKDNQLYHRYFSRNLEIYSLPEVDKAFRFFDFPTLAQTIALDSRTEEQKIIQAPSKKGKDPVFYDPILQTIRIEDALNQATITLFWTPEKGNEMELLTPPYELKATE